MNIIDKYYEAIQGIKDHISLPSDWDLITWDLCEEYYWCLTEDEDSVIFYKSIEDYQNDSEEENYYQTDIVTSEMWQNKSTLPANYTGIFKGKDYTGFLVDDPESIDEMIIAVFANRKNIENIEVLEPQMGFGKQETTISKTIKNKKREFRIVRGGNIGTIK